MKRVLQDGEIVYVLIFDKNRACHIKEGKVVECLERDHWGSNKYKVIVDNNTYNLEYPSKSHDEIQIHTREDMAKYYNNYKIYNENGLAAYKKALEDLDLLKKKLAEGCNEYGHEFEFVFDVKEPYNRCKLCGHIEYVSKEDIGKRK